MKTVLSAFAFATIAASAHADFQLRRDAVVKVTFDQTVSLRHNREGDAFSATAADGQDVPSGSRFLGHITEIHAAQDGRPAYIDLHFDALRLPDGSTFKVRAVPVKMDYLRRDSDGHFRIDQPRVRKENYVLGGLLGGTFLGALLHKPFEGAFAGVLAGILVGESNSVDSSEGIAVRRGDAMGALIQEDVRWDASYPGNSENYSYDDDPFGRRRSRNDDLGSRSSSGNNDDPFGHRWAIESQENSAAQAPARTDDPFGRANHSTNGDDAYRNDRHETRIDRDVVVTFDDKMLSIPKDQPAYWSDKVLMVPLKAVASQAGLSTDEVNDGRALYLTNDDMTIRLERDQTRFRVNGTTDTLPRKIELRDGVWYGPINLFSQTHIRTVRISGTKI